MANILESNIDLKVYSKVFNQEGNIAMKSKRVQNIISNGALTAFDIWYNVDKELYRDDIFKELLEYVRSNDLKIK